MEPPVDLLTIVMVLAILVMTSLAALAIGILIGGRKDVRHASPLDESWIHRHLERHPTHGDGENNR